MPVKRFASCRGIIAPIAPPGACTGRKSRHDRLRPASPAGDPAVGTALTIAAPINRALYRAETLPVFIQTSGGAMGIVPTVEMIVELARES